MKWLDHKIMAAIELYMRIRDEEVNQKLSDLKKESILFHMALKKLDQRIEQGLIQNTEVSRKELFGLRMELQEEFSINHRRLNLKIEERERQVREDNEIAIAGMSKILDKRLETLGEKKGLVVDLLKKVARLENAQQEATHVE